MRSFNVFALTLTITLALSCVHGAPKPGLLKAVGDGIGGLAHGLGRGVKTAAETAGSVINVGAKGLANTAGALVDDVETVIKGDSGKGLLNDIGDGVVHVIGTFGQGVQNVSNVLGNGLNLLLNKEVQEQAKSEVDRELSKSNVHISKEDGDLIYKAIINLLSQGELSGKELTDSKKASKTIRKYLKKNGNDISSGTIESYMDILLKVLANITVEVVQPPEETKQVEYVYYYYD